MAVKNVLVLTKKKFLFTFGQRHRDDNCGFRALSSLYTTLRHLQSEENLGIGRSV